MDGLGFLQTSLQNYKQFGVENSIHISNSAAYSDSEEVDVVIYKGWYDEINISTREEFLNVCAMSDHDYRVDESSLLFEIHNSSLVSRLTDTIIEGYLNNENYDIILSNVINILTPQQKKVLK